MRLVKIPFDSKVFGTQYAPYREVYINPDCIEFLYCGMLESDYYISIRTKAGHSLPLVHRVYKKEKDGKEYVELLLKILQKAETPIVKEEMTDSQFREYITGEFDKLAFKVCELQAENERLEGLLQFQGDYIRRIADETREVREGKLK